MSNPLNDSMKLLDPEIIKRAEQSYIPPEIKEKDLNALYIDTLHDNVIRAKRITNTISYHLNGTYDYDKARMALNDLICLLNGIK